MRYLVKEGHHNRPSLPSIHFGIKYLRFRIKFEENCYYPVLDTDDYDLNKGYGWTYWLIHHNSIRLCWRPDEKLVNRIQLHTYVYNKASEKKVSWSSIFTSADGNILSRIKRVVMSRIKSGVRTMNYITTIETGVWYDIEIKVTEPLNTVSYLVKTDSGLFLAQTGEKFVMPKFRWGYFADLFMGGTKPARQDTVVWIEKIESRYSIL